MLKEARRDPRDSPVAASTCFQQELTRELQQRGAAVGGRHRGAGAPRRRRARAAGGALHGVRERL